MTGCALPSGKDHTEKVPWIWFAVLTAAFFLVQHEWRISLESGELFGTTVDELDTLAKGSAVRRAVFPALALLSLSTFLRKRDGRVMVKDLLFWLMLSFLAWALLSLTWSEAPEMTLRRVSILTLLAITALCLSFRFSMSNVPQLVLFSSAVYLQIGIAAEVILGTFRPLSASYRFAGTLHPNSQGVNCALLFLSAMILLNGRNRLRRLLLPLLLEALLFLFLTKSRTSILLGVSAAVVYLFLKCSKLQKGLALVGLVCIASIVILLDNSVSLDVEAMFALGRGDADTASFTGRVPLWQLLLSYIARRPICGYGYDGFWSSKYVAEIASAQGWAISHAHSAYLDITLGLGVVGTAIFVLICTFGIRRALAWNSASPNGDAAFIILLLSLLAVNGLFESILFSIPQVTFYVILSLMSLCFPFPVYGGNHYDREDNRRHLYIQQG